MTSLVGSFVILAMGAALWAGRDQLARLGAALTLGEPVRRIIGVLVRLVALAWVVVGVVVLVHTVLR